MPFLFTTLLPAHSTMGQDSEVSDLHRKSTERSNLEHKMCANNADERALDCWGQRSNPMSFPNGASNEKKNQTELKKAYEEVADIKAKRNNVWCHLALTLDAKNPQVDET